MARETKINWAQLELDWRLGAMTVRDMAIKHNSGGYGDTNGITVSHTAIAMHFKNADIPRDAGGRAKRANWQAAKAPTLAPEVVGQALVAASYALDQGKALTGEQLAIATDAVLTANALIAHKADIKAARDVNVALIGELQAAMADTSQSLLSRATVCKTLTDSLAKLIALERQAYCIPDVAPEAAPTQAQAELSHDTARRFAFVLMQAAKAKTIPNS